MMNTVNTDSLKIIKLPIIGIDTLRYASQGKKNKSPQQYISPAYNLGMKSRDTSPKLRQLLLSKERQETIQRLDQNNSNLHEYSQLLSRFKDAQKNNAQNVIRCNRGDRQAQNVIIKKVQNQQLQQLLNQKHQERTDKLNDKDQFTMKDYRMHLTYEVTGLDRINREQRGFKERKIEMLQKIQQQKYGTTWKNRVHHLLNDSIEMNDCNIKRFQTLQQLE